MLQTEGKVMAEQYNKMMGKIARLTPCLARVMDHFSDHGQGNQRYSDDL